MLNLLSEAAEPALDLIEKNGGIHPFCKARSGSGDSIVITPDDGSLEPDYSGLGRHRGNPLQRISTNIRLIPGDLNLSNFESNLSEAGNRAEGVIY